MSEENKQCPFCGNKDIDTSPISGAAWCYDCHSVANDVDRWNTRPLEDALKARIAALEAALREIRDRAFKCLLPADEIETEREFCAFSEINDIGMEADRALKGDVKEGKNLLGKENGNGR